LRPWLFGVARRVVANQRRGEQRRSALSARLIENYDEGAFETLGPPEETSALARAFASLSETDRELLLLVAWEGLTREELAIGSARVEQSSGSACTAPASGCAPRSHPRKFDSPEVKSMSGHSSIDSLRRLAPLSDAEAAEVFGVAGREALLDSVTGLPFGRRARPRPDTGRRRSLVLAVAVLAAAATAAGAWACAARRRKRRRVSSA
jgi:hypothetical protein